MASLNGQTIASSYEQLLHTDTDGGGNGNTLVSIKDGDNGTTFGLKLATNKVEVIPSAADDANAFEVSKNNGTAVFTVDTSNSRVGIGTDSPAYPLDIVTTINNGAALAIRGDVDADGRFSGIQFGDNGSTSFSKGGIFYEGKDGFARGDLHFALEGGTGADNADLSDAKMTITHGGNVGIGTTSPGYQLDLRRNDTGTATSLGIRQLGTGDASMAFQTTTSPFGFCIGVDGSDSDAFKIATGTDDIGTNTKLTITTDGRVGIHTTSPNIGNTSSERGVLTIGSIDNGSANNFANLELQGHAISNDVPVGDISWFDHTNQNAIIRGGRDSSSTTGFLSFFTNGGSGVAERMRIKSDGRVEVGTTAGAIDFGSAGSTRKYLAIGTADNTALDFTNSGTINGLSISNASDTDDSSAGIVFSHRSTSAGSSGISYISSRNEGADRSALYFGTRGSDGVQLRMEIRNDGVMVSKKGLIFDGSGIGSGQTGISSSGTGGDLLLYSNGSAMMRIFSNGRVRIPSAGSANAKLDIDEDTSGQECIHLNHGSSGLQTMIVFKTSDTVRGSIQSDNSPSQTAYNTTSDERLKENIVEVNDALSIVNKIPVKQFNFIEDENNTPVIGYIGQELIKEYPQAVSVIKTDEYDDHHMVDQSKMVAVLMKAVQELSAKVEALENA